MRQSFHSFIHSYTHPACPPAKHADSQDFCSRNLQHPEWAPHTPAEPCHGPRTNPQLANPAMGPAQTRKSQNPAMGPARFVQTIEPCHGPRTNPQPATRTHATNRCWFAIAKTAKASQQPAFASIYPHPHGLDAAGLKWLKWPGQISAANLRLLQVYTRLMDSLLLSCTTYNYSCLCHPLPQLSPKYTRSSAGEHPSSNSSIIHHPSST
jgi:hypothetical protein